MVPTGPSRKPGTGGGTEPLSCTGGRQQVLSPALTLGLGAQILVGAQGGAPRIFTPL